MTPPGRITSRTLRATYQLAVLGLVLLAGLHTLPYLWPDGGMALDSAVRVYGDIATWLLGAVAVGLGVFGARHFPFPGRAATSDELRRPPTQPPIRPPARPSRRSLRMPADEYPEEEL